MCTWCSQKTNASCYSLLPPFLCPPRNRAPKCIVSRNYFKLLYYFPFIVAPAKRPGPPFLAGHARSTQVWHPPPPRSLVKRCISAWLRLLFLSCPTRLHSKSPQQRRVEAIFLKKDNVTRDSFCDIFAVWWCTGYEGRGQIGW